MNYRTSTRHWRNSPQLMLALGIALFASGAEEARCQDKQGNIRGTSTSANTTASVEDLYNAGVAAANKKQWEKACDFFTQAFAREANPQIAANLGNAELRAGRMRLAAEHLSYFLQEDKDTDKQARLEIQSLRDQAAQHVVMVKVMVDQDGADVVIDGIVRGKSPLKGSVFLEPGTHKFEARKVGFTARDQSYDLDKDVRREVRIKMEVDSRALNASNKKGGKAREPAWRSSLTAAAGGLGLIGIGLGTTFIWLAEDYGLKPIATLADLTTGAPSATSVCDADKTDQRCSGNESDFRKGELFLATGITSFVVGTLALGGMLALIGTSKPNETTVQIRPVAGKSQTGIVFEGSF